MYNLTILVEIVFFHGPKLTVVYHGNCGNRVVGFFRCQLYSSFGVVFSLRHLWPNIEFVET